MDPQTRRLIVHLYVLGRFPPPLDGQTMATQRVADLLDARHRVHRINTEPPSAGYIVAEAKLRPTRIKHFIRLTRRIRKDLSENPSAPVLWTSVSPVPLGHWRDLLATLPALRRDQPVIAVLHRATFDEIFSSPVTRPTARLLVRRVDHFVFLDRKLSERCAAWIPVAKRSVIPNTIDDSLLCSDEEVASKRMDRRERRIFRMLFLSNMMREKGYYEVIDAARMLRERAVPIEVTFAGGWIRDRDRATFEERVRSAGLSGVIEHLGPVSDRKRIKALHLAADVFLLPTYHPTEAQPLALIEALNAGTPIVTTRQGGIPEMVAENREAAFVEPRSAEAIAAAVQRLHDNAEYWQHLSEGARERFQQTFGPHAVRRQWEALLRRSV